MIRAALALGCAVTLSAGVVRAGADPQQAERSFPITEKWSVERLLSLTKAEVVALWKTLDPPAFTELDGHYMGLIPNAGAPATQKSTGDFMYNQESTRGYWLGKAYKPTSATKGEGYNRWRFPGGKVVLNLRFGTAIATSLIDDKPSYMMYYGAYNKNSTLIDELRKLDDYIYIGMGTTDQGNGKRSDPGHFVLVGPTDNWVGVDKVPMKKSTSSMQR
jgi:hypothetical protein